MIRPSLPALLLFLFPAWPSTTARGADDLAAEIGAVIDGPEYHQARWGVLIVDAKSGKTVYERDAERLFVPASTTKLFSCAAALCAYGPDYRFVTPVYRRGEVNDGVLYGDLILEASGDLTFGGRAGKDGTTLFANIDHSYAGPGAVEAGLTDSNPVQALDDLARQLRKQGIKEVVGEVMVDDRLFARTRATGSGPSVVSPMIVNDNILDVVVTPGKQPGERALVRMRPDTGLYQMDAEVKTVSADRPLRLVLQESGLLQFAVRGEIPVNHKPAIRVYHVEEPVLFARALFIEALRRQGIRVQTSLHRPLRFDLPPREACAKLPRVAEFTSAPLAEAIRVTLKVSQNLYASTMPLLVAAKHGERTLEQGLRRQGAFLKDLGVPCETISFGGGAGGDNADAITPAATVKLLQAMDKRPEGDAYFKALPALGVDGTLADAVDDDSPARGKVRAKSGTLYWYDRMNDRVLLKSKALAGSLETAKGTKLYVALFLNDMPLPRDVKAAREGRAIGKLCEVIHRHGP